MESKRGRVARRANARARRKYGNTNNKKSTAFTPRFTKA